MLSRERRVDSSLKAVRASHAYFNLVERLKGWNDDLRRERQRGDDSPGSDRAIIGTRGNAARHVVKKDTLDPIDQVRCRARTFARCQSPAVFAVTQELLRILYCILLLHMRGATTVLEVIRSVLTHEVVLKTAKVCPHVRELVYEERTGMQQSVAIDLFPFIRAGECFIALRRKRMCRRA